MSTDQWPGTTQALADLISRIRGASADDDFGPRQVELILADALTDKGDWLDRRYQQRADDRVSMLYPLYRAEDGRCSVLVAVFKPGVRVPVHNHGSWAVNGIYRGSEQETWFRRLDDGTVPGRARLEVERTLVNTQGTVIVMPDGTIHTVEALDGRDAVSVNVYGTDIVTQERSTFDLDRGTEETFRPDFAELG